LKRTNNTAFIRNLNGEWRFISRRGSDNGVDPFDDPPNIELNFQNIIDGDGAWGSSEQIILAKVPGVGNLKVV
jgi:hypothetical protein